MRIAPTAPTTLLACLLLGACATAGSGTISSIAPTGAPVRPRAIGGRDPITADEIAHINVASAYDAIAKLRGTYLSARGLGSFASPVRSTRPVVFVDGMEMGTLYELRSIPARDVLEIRFLSSGEATYRYGQGFMAGVIAVTTKR